MGINKEKSLVPETSELRSLAMASPVIAPLEEKPMVTTDELLDALIKDCKKPEDLIGENGLLKQLVKLSLDREL